MAEALLIRALADRPGPGVEATVSSAGTTVEGRPPMEETIEVMAARDLDVREHRSRILDAARVQDADLVLGMAREHVRAATLCSPDAFGRTFTLKELVRLGEATPPRAPAEPLSDYLARVGEGRSPRQLLGDSADDDVVDPMGRRFKVYKQVATEIEDHVNRLVALIAPG